MTPRLLVIGAGPAGATAAYRAATLGFDVTLVDRATFPRGKVCGCCLNGAALATLERIGLRSTIDSLQPIPLKHAQLSYEGKSVTIPFAGGVSISREALDVALIQAAVASGVSFHEGTRATVRPDHAIELHDELGTREHATDILIVADGLNGNLSSALTGSKPSIDEASYIGAGAVLTQGGQPAVGTVHMAANQSGYVGLVQLEDGRVDLAAALASETVKAHGSLGVAVGYILREASGRSWPEVEAATWRGTPLLSRTPGAVSGKNWLAVGDASGYVEPFTGEGMAWGIIAGVAAAEAWASHGADAPTLWPTMLEQLLGQRRRACRRLTFALRRPWFCRWSLRCLSVAPWLSARTVRDLHIAPQFNLNPRSRR